MDPRSPLEKAFDAHAETLFEFAVGALGLEQVPSESLTTAAFDCAKGMLLAGWSGQLPQLLRPMWVRTEYAARKEECPEWPSFGINGVCPGDVCLEDVDAQYRARLRATQDDEGGAGVAPRPSGIEVKSQPKASPVSGEVWQRIKRHTRAYLARNWVSPQHIDDLTHEVLAAVISEGDYPTPEEDLRRWVLGFARNFLKRYRSGEAMAQDRRGPGEPEQCQSSTLSPVDLAVLHLEFRRLDRQSRAALWLVDVAGLNGWEAGVVLGCGERHANRLAGDARAQLERRNTHRGLSVERG